MIHDTPVLLIRWRIGHLVKKRHRLGITWRMSWRMSLYEPIFFLILSFFLDVRLPRQNGGFDVSILTVF